MDNNTSLPYEHEWSCISYGYNLKKRKHDLSENQRKIIHFLID